MGKVFRIEVLSPTHIGNGNSFKPMDIGEHGGFIYIFDLDKVIEKIPEERLEEFTELIANFGDKSRNIYGNLGDMLSKVFGIRQDQWDEISLYKVENKNGRIYEIYEEIKYGDEVYVPGSSIKGLIRTAVIYCFLKNEGYSFLLESKRMEDKNNPRRYKIVEYLCMIKPEGKERKIEGLTKDKPDLSKIESEIRKDTFTIDPTKDVFKCLKVSDSKGIYAEEGLEVRKVFVANTTSFEKRGGRIKMFPSTVECFRVGQVLTDIHIGVDGKVIDSLSKVYSNNPKFSKIIEMIKEWDTCLKTFSQDLIEAEIKFWEEQRSTIDRNIRNVYRRFSDINRNFSMDKVIGNLKSIKRLIDSGNLIFRLGKFSGYLSHSIGILIANDISKKPYNLGRFGKMLYKTAHEDIFPLTRRLTLDNQTLGWCKLVESDSSETVVSKRDEQVKPEEKQSFNKEDMMEAFKSKGWRVS